MASRPGTGEGLVAEGGTRLRQRPVELGLPIWSYGYPDLGPQGRGSTGQLDGQMVLPLTGGHSGDALQDGRHFPSGSDLQSQL